MNQSVVGKLSSIREGGSIKPLSNEKVIYTSAPV